MILTDKRYTGCTVFLILSAVFNQLSGVNAINIYSSTILETVPGLPIAVGVYMLAVANVIGSLMGPIVQKWVSIRTMLIVGQFVMASFLAGVVIFQIFNQPTLVLVCMVGMIITYQCNIGSYYFVYAS